LTARVFPDVPVPPSPSAARLDVVAESQRSKQSSKRTAAIRCDVAEIIGALLVRGWPAGGKSRAMRTSGTPVPSLYGAGAAVGCMHGPASEASAAPRYALALDAEETDLESLDTVEAAREPVVVPERRRFTFR
jgi:hypothetical protein